jgi:hypothetical protein
VNGMHLASILLYVERAPTAQSGSVLKVFVGQNHAVQSFDVLHHTGNQLSEFRLLFCGGSLEFVLQMPKPFSLRFLRPKEFCQRGSA